MELEPSVAGAESELLCHSYGWQELALYALSVGADPAIDLDLVYEGPGMMALPTYAVVPAFEAVQALQARVGGSARGLVHLGQRLTLRGVLPPHGQLRTRGRVRGVYDMHRCAQAILETHTEDERQEVVFDTQWTVLHTEDTCSDGGLSPRAVIRRAPERAADVELQMAVASNQAALYRLNGDNNPLHIDPAAARAAGYERPILHGLCTLGMCCVLLRRLGADLRKLRCLEAQFRAAVFPGDELVVSFWREPGAVFFRGHARARPSSFALQYGYAELAE